MAEGKSGGQKWGAWVLGGCGCLIFGIGIVVLAGFFFYSKITEAPLLVVEGFLQSAGNGDVETAHGYFSTALKEVQSLEDFRAVVESNGDLFKVKTRNFTQMSADLSTATFSGTVDLENGSTTSAEFILIKEDGGWRLHSYNIGGE